MMFIDHRWRSLEKSLAVFGLFFTAAAAGLLAAARKAPQFAEWYSVHIYPALVRVIGGAFGIFPFSAAEIGLYAMLAGALVFLVRNRRRLPLIASGLFALAGFLLFLYTVNCGINYYRKPFSAYLNLKTGEAESEDLAALCGWLTKAVNESREKLEADSGAYRNMERKGVEAMTSLGESYPQLAGFYPSPKPVLFSAVLSVQQYSGIYLPFTVEANFNREMTAYNIPHTICHELSHLRGFMREDEANFIGYLACLNSAYPDYHYSGALLGWIYAGNALAEVDFEEYTRLYGMLAPEIREDLEENSRFWDRYEGRAAEAANQINDVYLKINGQPEGVRTYGRVVDLMLADFLQNRGGNRRNGL